MVPYITMKLTYYRFDDEFMLISRLWKSHGKSLEPFGENQKWSNTPKRIK